MENLLHKIIEILREHVSQNNNEIRYNQEDINRLLSERTTSGKISELDDKYSLNKELLDENAEFINFQLSITEFMEKYGHLFSGMEEALDLNDRKDEISDLTNDSLFQKTVNGQIKFDHNHPHFNDPLFFNLLLKHYEELEDYEMCDHLYKMMKSHS